MRFNKEQLAAICHKDGSMMVLAGPGSGKTTVLVERILYLTEQCGVPPEALLVITFTRAAAEEMQKRYQKRRRGISQSIEQTAAGPCGRLEKAGDVCFGTFHSVFFQILREEMQYTAEDVLEERQCQALLWDLCQAQFPSLGLSADLISMLLAEHSRRKNTGNETSPDEGQRALPLPEPVFQRIMQAYGAALKKRHLLDFDDMLLQALALFRRDRALLARLRARWQYIMVDEFQDINRVQYESIKLLAAPRRNLFIVGDDDQSIYGFRGSVPELMLGFPREYPAAKRVLLRSNYRSDSAVVDASLRLIRNNQLRFSKELRAERRGGMPPDITGYPSAEAEAEAIARRLREKKAAGSSLSALAVLYRSRRAAARLRTKLAEMGLTEGEPRLMTFHAAKGLEFDEVFIIGANEGMTPSKEALASPKLIEEERRMFYVAVTRARHSLHISFTNGRYNRTQMEQSRFLAELCGEAERQNQYAGTKTGLSRA